MDVRFSLCIFTTSAKFPSRIHEDGRGEHVEPSANRDCKSRLGVSHTVSSSTRVDNVPGEPRARASCIIGLFRPGVLESSLTGRFTFPGLETLQSRRIMGGAVILLVYPSCCTR